MKESVDQLVSMWAPRWPLHNGAIYEVQSQDRPNWFSRPRGRSQSTRKRQHGCHAQPPAPPFQRIPEPMITGCKYDGKPGWQHIPRMSQEVDLWWAILEHGGGGFRGWDMSTEPQNVSGSGAGRIYFGGRGLCMWGSCGKWDEAAVKLRGWDHLHISEKILRKTGDIYTGRG